MGTRAHVIVKDSGSEHIWLYRHRDGYPSWIQKILKIFLLWLIEGRIRDNAEQAAGWLIVIGHTEYNKPSTPGGSLSEMDRDWEVGAYEPTVVMHGDMRYLYVVDLERKEIRCYEEWPDDFDTESDSEELGEPFAVINKDNITEDINTIINRAKGDLVK